MDNNTVSTVCIYSVFRCWSNTDISLILSNICNFYICTHAFLEAACVLFVLPFRTPQSSVPSSSAQRAIATPFQSAAAGAQGEAAGTVASRCRLQAGSLCSCVNRSRSKGSGWRPSERSSLNPWPRRTTLVRYCYCTWYSTSSCVCQMA